MEGGCRGVLGVLAEPGAAAAAAAETHHPSGGYLQLLWCSLELGQSCITWVKLGWGGEYRSSHNGGGEREWDGEKGGDGRRGRERGCWMVGVDTGQQVP